MQFVTPVILCGGSGTRLWPLSRTGFPKQFLCITDQQSLFQQAATRLAQLGDAEIAVTPPLLVTGEDHRFLATEQLREVGVPLGLALLEPVGRGTAPALTLAALAAESEGQDPVLVVTPADQTVANTAAFTQAMRNAIREAAAGTLVILGVTPDRPETGYGYIQAQATDTNTATTTTTSSSTGLPVLCFVEKPDDITAQFYLNAGGYFWNAGIFVLKASVWLKALEQFRPDILQATRSAWELRRLDGCFIRPGEEAFNVIPAESIDYAVMEHAPGADLPIKMVPLNAGWSDLGAWDAVWGVLPKDLAGNAHVGDVLCTDSRNTLVHATSRLVSLVGVDDLIVIETPDALLVADRAHSQDVKHIVNILSKQRRDEHTLHRKVYRPWGWYDTIDECAGLKVKRILVQPGASLSLQKHHHRAEHWVVVKGTAEVTIGVKKFILIENQSTYIPIGVVHRLSNSSDIPLEIIEVQLGDYLGEDDITRINDEYGRV